MTAQSVAFLWSEISTANPCVALVKCHSHWHSFSRRWIQTSLLTWCWSTTHAGSPSSPLGVKDFTQIRSTWCQLDVSSERAQTWSLLPHAWIQISCHHSPRFSFNVFTSFTLLSVVLPKTIWNLDCNCPFLAWPLTVPLTSCYCG